jgi:hypothetical protein
VIHAAEAILQVIADISTQSCCAYPDRIASSNEGIKYESVGSLDKGFTVIGETPRANNVVNIRNARKKFIVTHAINTRILCIQGRVMNAHFFSASGHVGSSPSIRTNPPIGRRLNVYSVHFLSFQIRIIFGGIQKPNSSTCMRQIRATIKCPNS